MASKTTPCYTLAMPSGNTVFLLFGLFLATLNPFFTSSDFKALGATPEPYLVVLDPGHGGNDTGALGTYKGKPLAEKDVALAIAVRTAKILRNPDLWRPLGRPVKVLLTRERDTFVSLEQRADLAHQNKAHLFLSIHANSDPTSKARGLETFFLNNTDNESTQKLEKIENKHSKRYKPGSQSLLIRTVEADAVVDVSREAAQTVHRSLADHLRKEGWEFQDRGVRQALLYVLLDARVPAVLLEAFFLSHQKDKEKIAESENRQKIAEGLAKGILRFLALQ